MKKNNRDPWRSLHPHRFQQICVVPPWNSRIFGQHWTAASWMFGGKRENFPIYRNVITSSRRQRKNLEIHTFTQIVFDKKFISFFFIFVSRQWRWWIRDKLNSEELLTNWLKWWCRKKRKKHCCCWLGILTYWKKWYCVLNEKGTRKKKAKLCLEVFYLVFKQNKQNKRFFSEAAKFFN